jgi:hypothetical protein
MRVPLQQEIVRDQKNKIRGYPELGFRKKNHHKKVHNYPRTPKNKRGFPEKQQFLSAYREKSFLTNLKQT